MTFKNVMVYAIVLASEEPSGPGGLTFCAHEVAWYFFLFCLQIHYHCCCVTDF
jgi:hypothetical protein